MPYLRSPSRPANARLNVVTLETRETPATVIYSSGVLTISNIKAPSLTPTLPVLNITETSPGVVQVQDAVTNGIYKVGNGIRVNGTNFDDTINIKLLNNGLLPGNLKVYASNGNDTINIDAPGGGPGSIGGYLLVDMNNGLDVVNIGKSGLVKVGSIVELGGGAGNDTVTVSKLTTGGYFFAHRVNQLTLGFGGGTTTINGYLDVDNIGDFGIGNSLKLTNTAQVAGSFEYTGGTGADSIFIDGFIGNVPGQFGIVSTFDGDSTLEFGANAQIGSAGSLTNFTFNAGDNANFGTDSISIASGAIFSNNLTINMGNGTNLYNLSGPFTVGNNFTLTAGSGNDNLGKVGSVVGGDGVFDLGSGNDSVSFKGISSFTKLTVNMGDGNDTIVFKGTVSNQAKFNLGAGADIFNAGFTGPSWGSATIDFGLDFNPDVVTVKLALSLTTTIVNFTLADTYTILP